MAFADFETSDQNSLRVQLITITAGNETFRLATSEADFDLVGVPYTATNVSLSNIVQAARDRNKPINLTMPTAHPFVQRYVATLPGQVVSVRVLEIQRDDPDQQTIEVFSGSTSSVAFSNHGTESQIALLPRFAQLGRTAPRHTYQVRCNHVLYDSRCRVNKALFRFSGNIGSYDASTSVMTVPGLAAAKGGSFAVAGYVTNADLTDYRMVISQNVDALTLHFPFASNFPVTVGTAVDVQAGCAHDTAACSGVFNNFPNYGGNPYNPQKNVFQSGL